MLIDNQSLQYEQLKDLDLLPTCVWCLVLVLGGSSFRRTRLKIGLFYIPFLSASRCSFLFLLHIWFPCQARILLEQLCRNSIKKEPFRLSVGTLPFRESLLWLFFLKVTFLFVCSDDEFVFFFGRPLFCFYFLFLFACNATNFNERFKWPPNNAHKVIEQLLLVNY